MCMGVLAACMSIVSHACLLLTEAKEGVESPGTGVTGSWEPLCGSSASAFNCWEICATQTLSPFEHSFQKKPSIYYFNQQPNEVEQGNATWTEWEAKEASKRREAITRWRRWNMWYLRRNVSKRSMDKKMFPSFKCKNRFTQTTLYL